MSKNSNAGQRTRRQQIPTKIIVERHYVGTEKMEIVFKRIQDKLFIVLKDFLKKRGFVR